MIISAVILTKNEEKNIERCIESVIWCDEIIVVDDYSEDKTLVRIQNSEVRIKNKIKIYKKHLNSDFAGQRNFGLVKAIGDWVLFIDADEIISSELSSEIKSQISNLKSQISGYYIKRIDYFMGKWMKFGEVGNMKLLRLAKRNSGKWEGWVHEVWEISGKIGELTNPILHYPHPTVSEFLEDINRYTDIVAQYWKEQGRKMDFWEIWLFPLGKFIHNYVFRLGILDGIAGMVIAIFMSFHSFLARGKFWLSTHK